TSLDLHSRRDRADELFGFQCRNDRRLRDLVLDTGVPGGPGLRDAAGSGFQSGGDGSLHQGAIDLACAGYRRVYHALPPHHAPDEACSTEVKVFSFWTRVSVFHPP